MKMRRFVTGISSYSAVGEQSGAKGFKGKHLHILNYEIHIHGYNDIKKQRLHENFCVNYSIKKQRLHESFCVNYSIKKRRLHEAFVSTTALNVPKS